MANKIPGSLHSLRVSHVEWERYRRAAQEQGISISSLIRQSMDFCLNMYPAQIRKHLHVPAANKQEDYHAAASSQPPAD